VVLDAWAVIAAARAEPAATRVRTEIQKGDAGISWINLGEVSYTLSREFGLSHAEQVVDAARRELNCEEPDAELVLAAARIKAAERLSYADAFAVATAERQNAPLLSGDPEIVALARQGLRVVDLRADDPSPPEGTGRTGLG